MASVFAEPPFLSLFEEITEDILDSLAVIEIGFIKCHHVDENDVPLVHEKVAEQIKPFGFTDSKRKSGWVMMG